MPYWESRGYWGPPRYPPPWRRPWGLGDIIGTAIGTAVGNAINPPSPPIVYRERVIETPVVVGATPPPPPSHAQVPDPKATDAPDDEADPEKK